jgi:hypothetical protein
MKTVTDVYDPLLPMYMGQTLEKEGKVLVYNILILSSF